MVCCCLGPDKAQAHAAPWQARSWCHNAGVLVHRLVVMESRLMGATWPQQEQGVCSLFVPVLVPGSQHHVVLSCCLQALTAAKRCTNP